MKNKIGHPKYYRHFFRPAITGLLLAITFLSIAQTQPPRAYEGEKALCKISVNGKAYHPRINQIGAFDRMNIPLETIPTLEITYPDGAEGDQVVLSVEDGGKLGNGKSVEVAYLDKQKKLSFSFHFIPDDPGIYRIMLRKGKDTKIVELWAVATASN